MNFLKQLQQGQQSTNLFSGEAAKGFGLNTGTMGALGSGIEGLGGLASIYFGNKQLGLAEDQYNTNKEFGNRNLANQATTINNSLEARYRAALAAKGFTPGEESENPVYPALKKAGFKVSIEGKIYTNIYASRVIAVMHENLEDGEPLEL